MPTTTRTPTKTGPIVRLAGLLLALPIAGCLEREETIEITKDGSVQVRHVVRGDAGDFDGGEARYPTEAPFVSKRQDRMDDHGRPAVTVTSSAEFAKVEDMPKHFGKADDTNISEAMQFDTRLKTWTADNQLWRRFERVYHARNWASYRVAYRKAFGPIEAHMKNADQIWQQPLGERIRVVRALSDYESSKWQLWLESAVRAVVTDQDVETQVLILQNELDTYFSKQIDHRAIAMALSKDLGELEAVGVKVTQDLQALVRTQCQAHLGLDAQGLDSIKRRMALAQHGFEVSHDLEDEKFVVRLKLPGDLITHNAAKVHQGYLVWEFEGRDLRDREHHLVAVTREKQR